MSYERITEDAHFDGPVRNSHEVRYRLASGFVGLDDVVLDACCGEGYGQPLLMSGKVDSIYFGVDKNPPEGLSDVSRAIYGYDFETQEGWLPERHDVFVGMECIEHLDDAGVKHFVEVAKRARKWIIVSTPIVPNKNPYHKQNFTEQQMLDLFQDKDWEEYSTLYQTGRYGIFVFKRR